MNRGPVEYIVISFPGSRFNGDVVPALAELVERQWFTFSISSLSTRMRTAR